MVPKVTVFEVGQVRNRYVSCPCPSGDQLLGGRVQLRRAGDRSAGAVLPFGESLELEIA